MWNFFKRITTYYYCFIAFISWYGMTLVFPIEIFKLSKWPFDSWIITSLNTQNTLFTAVDRLVMRPGVIFIYRLLNSASVLKTGRVFIRPVMFPHASSFIPVLRQLYRCKQNELHMLFTNCIKEKLYLYYYIVPELIPFITEGFLFAASFHKTDREATVS